MSGVNKCIIVGNLGQDPEVKYMPNGNAVANITVATSESWKDKDTGQQQERTEWHRVVFFNKLAEIVGQYLKKGSKIYIEGSLRTRKWQDQSGADRYTTEIVAKEMQMLDSRSDSQQSAPQQNNPRPQQQSQYANQTGQPMQGSPQQSNYNLDHNGDPLSPQQMQQQGVNNGQQQPLPNDFDQEIPF